MDFESEANVSSKSPRTTKSKDYRSRHKHLRTTIQQLIFENTALTREISSTDARLISAKVERKALLKRLSQYEKPDSKLVKSGQKKTSTSSGVKKKIKQEADVPGVASRDEVKSNGIVVGDNKNVKVEKMDL